MSQSSINNTKPFILLLFSICFAYLCLALVYNHYAMLSVDEFWFAHRIYEYKSALPYRDFAPYKTILGYYLLLPTMLFGENIMQTLMMMKDSLAVLNTLLLFISSCWLTRFFSRTSVLASLTILITTEIMITYSTQVRVDLLGYWFGFFALLLLLEKRNLLAGILMGLGFITTQKTIWYLFACNVGLFAQWIIYQRQIKNIKPIVLFNIAFGIIITAYLAFWSVISDWQTVINSVFHEASAMYQLESYDPARKLFWHITTLYNPLIFLLSPITIFSLLITYDDDKKYSLRFFITIFSLVILSCLVPYKQVFPYYMQVTIPVFFILYAGFIDWLIAIFNNNPRTLVKPLFLWIGVALYISSIIILTFALNLPIPYLLIALIPISLLLYLQQPGFQKLYSKIILITLVMIGFIYPLSLMPAKLIWLNGDYQKAHIQTINSLLAENGDYVAGIELIYNKTQPIPGMRHLMAPAISYLYSPTDKLRNVMLASLYEDPRATIDNVIQNIQASDVKFYVNNYRMNGLPKKIREYLDSQYEHWWGSIYLYAPYVEKGEQNIMLKFSGNYFLESDLQVMINGKEYMPHANVYLNKGQITSRADQEYRLKLVPSVKGNQDFKEDTWKKLMF